MIRPEVGSDSGRFALLGFARVAPSDAGAILALSRIAIGETNATAWAAEMGRMHNQTHR